VLGENLVIFGEWCFAVHSIEYTRLPDWWLLFDVWDKSAAKFWSADRRDRLTTELELSAVPRIAQGRFTRDDLVALLGQSKYGDALMEGLYIRADDGPFECGRAKLVRAEFAQSIDDHWMNSPLRKNRLVVTPPKDPLV
jgi:hypothetical protein